MRRPFPPALAGLVVVFALAGCGGSDSGDDEPREPGLPKGIVAQVADGQITKAEAEHWSDAAVKQGGCRGQRACREQAMQFLVSALWLTVHAKRTGVEATPREVERTFRKQKRQAFPRERDYRRWLEDSGRTEVDLRVQVKLSILTNKIQASLDTEGGKKNDEQRLNAFVTRFRRTYKRETTCRRAFAPKGQCGKIVD